MDNNTSFDPMVWAAASDNNSKSVNNVNDQMISSQVQNSQPVVPVIGNELEKAKATLEELGRLGANIAESYNDWWECGCALAELGPEARDLFHQVSSQSTKYRETDCEKKWLECLTKRDGRITIATFYKMAQDAGVDLSAISRQFPSEPSQPHFSASVLGDTGNKAYSSSEYTHNNNVMGNNPTNHIPFENNSERLEAMRESEGNYVSAADAEAFQYTETFSNKLDITSPPCSEMLSWFRPMPKDVTR